MLHSSTFEYLKPTDDQIADMALARQAAADYCGVLEAILPDGPDKTYAIRKVREVAMWANVAITRMADGAPRMPDNDLDPEGTRLQEQAETFLANAGLGETKTA